jgi:hypothetical protein
MRKLADRQKNQEIAASKAGMNAITARRCLAPNRLPGELEQKRPWHTSEDPFSHLWDQVRPQIEENVRPELS